MMNKMIVSLMMMILGMMICVVSGEDLSNGLGNGVNWVKLDESFNLAKQTNKPILLIIHKSWCGACKSLKEILSKSKEFEDASKDFIMTNTIDDDEPSGDKYAPDGQYIPRIIFISPNGEVKNELTNVNGNPKYKYYYSSDKQLVDSMKSAKLYFDKSDNITGDNTGNVGDKKEESEL